MDESKWLIICLYVDNLLTGCDAKSMEAIAKFLKSKYSFLLEGKISHYLGISVKTGNGKWRLNQTTKIKQFLHKNRMETANPAD
jgi:hypothetical protein